MTAADAQSDVSRGDQGEDASELDQLAINTIRTLAIDAVERADSGHPGAPMGFAPVAYTLWTRFLNYDPARPLWPNRDRFVLSNGHASMLLYALLHLAGVQRADSHRKLAVSLDDIKAFREFGSVTPGHPEHGHTTGVETTTGPLGQGVGASVGMAMAERWIAARYNRPGHTLFDYRIYVICSDGDLMEGLSGEAASLAGHLQLSNLVWIYDDNHISIEGDTSLAFTEDVEQRFQGYGWATRHVDDANDCEAVAEALVTAQATGDRPTLIRVRSIIGYGSPHEQGSSKIHSDALGADEVRATKRQLGWPEDAEFLVPDGVRQRFDETLRARGRALRESWDAARAEYAKAFPQLSAELDLIATGGLPKGWDAGLPSFPADAKGVATREASGKALNALAPKIPWLVGGSADLAPSNKTMITGERAFEAEDYGGRNLHFGVREHVMGTAANGLALSGLRPYVGTFLVFNDYMRPAVRIAALMQVPIVYVYTHDSIGLGQDGPTHQPVEQLASLRAMPGLTVIRPADANEAVEAWRVALQRSGPVALSLSRQALPTLDRARFAPAAGLARGAYVLSDAEGGAPEVILMATGSEVSLCVQAQETLSGRGVRSRVVSMPSWELFEVQEPAYREAVLPRAVTARVAVEAGAALGWDRYAGPTGEIIAMHTFGSSAPIGDLMRHFGFTAERVTEAAWAQVREARSREVKS